MHDLLDGTDVLERRGNGREAFDDVEVQSVAHDSRAANAGALFACIRGATTDGHAHAAAAVEGGAVALLVEEMLPLLVAQARVAWVRGALGPIAARFHGFPSRAMRVLGVTGTNGKTTTTYILDAIGNAARTKTGLIGTVGTRIGDRELPPGRTTPEATDLQALFATMRDESVETVAMEVSSHALEQHRVDGTTFAAVAFTNLSHDHLDFHGSMDAYFAAKARLFTRDFADTAAINIDDPRGRELAASVARDGLEVWTFGLESDAEVTAHDVVLARDHTELTIRAPRHHAIRVRSSLVGPFNVANLLAAAATAYAARFSPAAVEAGLQAPIVVPGRFERVDAGQAFTVVVDYAHTPDALERVLGAARALAGADGRVVVVYGCGGDRDRAKRPLMGAAAAHLADVAYLTSDNPRSEDPASIAADVRAGVDAAHEPFVELDRRLAIRAAVGDAHAGDVVVIAGKGHETGQTAGGRTVPFDDRVVAREELEALACR